MNRNFGISFLIVCFGFSNINVSLAAQMAVMPSQVVPPDEIQELNQQMIYRDQQNQAEEIAIKKLIEENNELTQATLAHQEDEGLQKINQTMLSYRSMLKARQREHMVADGERWPSRYGDLIALTVYVDDMKDAQGKQDIRQDLEAKNDMFAQKYQMLSALKDEMTTLNEKLVGQRDSGITDRDTMIENYQKIAQQQQDKIQMLVGRLDEMDQKIARFDELLAEKDHQIALLKNNLSLVQSEAAAKDETIKEKNEQMDLLKSELENKITEDNNQSPKDAIIKQQKDQIALLQEQAQELSSQAARPIKAPVAQMENLSPPANSRAATSEVVQPEIDFLKNQIQEQANDLKIKDKLIAEQTEDLSRRTNYHAVPSEAASPQVVYLKSQLLQQSEDLKNKDRFIKTQSDQIANLSRQLEYQNNTFGIVQAKIAALKIRIKQQMQQQADDLKAKDESIRWLSQVVNASKNKAQYYQLTSQQDQMKMRQVQEEAKYIRGDFKRHDKDYDRIERDVTSLKGQVGQLVAQLADRQNQVTDLHAQRDALKDALAQKQERMEVLQQDCKAMRNENMKLAHQLIDLHQEEAVLLGKKSDLLLKQFPLLDNHVGAVENRINVLLADHRIQRRIQDLEAQLRDKEEQIAKMKAQIQDNDQMADTGHLID